MNRKEFIQKSAGSLAALSVTNLLLADNKSKKIRNQDEANLTFYKKYEEQRHGQTYIEEYYFIIPASAKFCIADEITLEVYQVPKDTDDEYAQQKAIYTIPVKKCKSSTAEGKAVNSFKCKKLIKKEGPDLLLESPLEIFIKKKPLINLKSGDDESWTIDVLNKKEVVMSLEEFDPYEILEDEDCFLTTVCVKHLGKADNCIELETLRNFRDSYVRNSENGADLVAMYYEIGPKIVGAINSSENKNAILQKMYADLVKPSIALINDHKLDEAKQFYVDYTLGVYGSIA
jgi:hypothetical protein